MAGTNKEQRNRGMKAKKKSEGRDEEGCGKEKQKAGGLIKPLERRPWETKAET